MNSKRIVAFVGLMGVGKSTLVSHLKLLRPELIYIDEPLEDWINIKDPTTGDNLLGLFYADQPRWSYTFENIAFITRLDRMLTALASPSSSVIVMDSMVATDRNVYALMLHDQRKMTEIEWICYNIWHDFYLKYIQPHQITYVYLRCDPHIVFHRVNDRKRTEEKKIELEYLIELNRYFEQWVQEMIQRGQSVIIHDFNYQITDPQYRDLVINLSNQVIK